MVLLNIDIVTKQFDLCILDAYNGMGGARLDTNQLDTTNHSDRCLEAFHCSSAVSGSCPNGGHPNGITTIIYRTLFYTSI